MTWKFDAEKKVGHLRADFNDGRAFARWFEMQDLNKDSRAEIQSVITEIFKVITSLDKVVEMCRESKMATGEENYFTTSEHFNYWIRLNPCKGDYNVYVHTYNN